MAFKLKSGNTTNFKQMGSSPAKQNNLALDLGLGPKRSNDRSVPSGSISAKTSEEARNDANAKKTLKRGKAKVDYMQHITGLSKNSTGEEIEQGRTDYLNSLDESPAKQRVDPLDLGLLDEAKKVKVNKGLPKNFNTSGKDSWVKRSKEILKKGAKKGSRVIGGKTLGLLGLLMANDAYAKTDQPKHHKPKAKPMSVKKVRAISKSLPNASSELMKKIKKK